LNTPRVFDQKQYENLNFRRAAALTRLLGELKDKLRLRTAIDVGCGLGYFSKLLGDLGLDVTGVDGRPENVEEARRRVPHARFQIMNVEDPSVCGLGPFDLVLCLGLLYHLENPFLAIRNMQKLAPDLLIVESVIFPGAEPVMGLVDEGHAEDQGLNYVAFYPTEACLIKMIYRSGIRHVYRVTEMPDHPDFCPPQNERRVRTMLAASAEFLHSPLLERAAEPIIAFRPWIAEDARSSSFSQKMRRFAEKPWVERVAWFRCRWVRK
jgi:SAM-dependent methyltransferase